MAGPRSRTKDQAFERKQRPIRFALLDGQENPARIVGEGTRGPLEQLRPGRLRPGRLRSGRLEVPPV